MPETIIIAQPKFRVGENCPNCNNPVGVVRAVRILCNMCKRPFLITLSKKSVEVYMQIIKKKIEEYNEVVLQADLNNRDYLRTFNQIVEEIERRHRYLEVDKPDKEKVFSNKIKCKKCGTCLEEFVCKSCQNIFKRRFIKIKNIKKPLNECNRCGSTKIRPYWFEKVARKGKTRICPSCATPRIQSSISFKKEGRNAVCSRCKGKDLYKQKEIEVIKTTITMQRRYWND